MVNLDAKFIEKIQKIYNDKKYQEANNELSDEILELYNSAHLYALKSLAFLALKEYSLALSYAQKSILTDSDETHGYFARALYWQSQKEFDKAIEDYNKLIQFDDRNVVYFNNRANIWADKNYYNHAIEDYSKAIEINVHYVEAYYNRANIWQRKGEYSKAIEDYNKALEMNSNYIEAYCNRGIAWKNKGEPIKAIEDYNKALEINENFANAHYNRAVQYELIGKLKEALYDYQRYITLQNDINDYYTKFSTEQIKQLNKKLKDSWYDEIDKIIKDIKELLLFEEQYITHYTSLSAAKAMVLDKSRFRLSEGSFLNDTSEGRELFKFLSFHTGNQKKDETIAEIFVERPFIGSFVADTKHDDLTLWRMYGKEEQSEAKGCALTINRERFLKRIDDHINSLSTSEKQTSADRTIQQNGENFTFYKVAYRTKDEFLISGSTKVETKKLNELLVTLKEKIKPLRKEKRNAIIELLNDIAYLFKTAEYQYEQEVRLVVQGVGFTKTIENEAYPPKVYIKLIDITSVLNKVTLGPKVERADEWAAAFNYKIKEEREAIEIVISHLPFK